MLDQLPARLTNWGTLTHVYKVHLYCTVLLYSSPTVCSGGCLAVWLGCSAGPLATQHFCTKSLEKAVKENMEAILKADENAEINFMLSEVHALPWWHCRWAARQK
jgi:hypothetical protein